MSSGVKSLDLFSNFVPEGTELYCYGLWREYDFTFKIHKPRKTKLGDFRFRKGKTIITVNNNLNRYAFLLTYLHEVAHLVTYKKFGVSVLPHGVEWKEEFKMLMFPVFEVQVLPHDVEIAAKAYMHNPKASSCADTNLLLVLASYDKDKEGLLRLSEIPTGERFVFQEKEYLKEAKRRTRSLCLELSSKRKYLIAEVAEVKRPLN